MTDQPAITQTDLIILAQWLDAEGWSLEEFIQVLEKPHHFLDELAAARAVIDATSTVDFR